MPRRPVEPDQLAHWIAFLRNHKEAIAAMDLFTLPTLSLRVLYGLFIIDHGRRRIVHFNATDTPTAQWVIQQLREAFPFDTAPAHLIFDRDTIFSAAVVRFVQALGANPRRIAYRSPWQNPVAQRWMGSSRRELLDHVLVFDQRHLVRLVGTYASYDHDDRCHLGLGKDSPSGRQVTPRPSQSATVLALPRVGALQRRYAWREAAEDSPLRSPFRPRTDCEEAQPR
jgi:transposase InsO family protein